MTGRRRILLLIDYLGSGGAQRQMCLLATLLQQNDYAVSVMTYHEGSFFQNLLDRSHVPLLRISAAGRIRRLAALRKAIHKHQPDVLISFLHTPNMIAELAGLPRRNFNLIVSERNTDITGMNARKALRFFLHRFADAVVTNSFSQRDYLQKHAAHLSKQVHVISNCVDLDSFSPGDKGTPRPAGSVRMLGIGRIHPQKNLFRLASALALVREELPDLDIRIDWYGEGGFVGASRQGEGRHYTQSLLDHIGALQLKDRFRLHPSREDVVTLYRNADVFCLPSLYEGCSNVLGEALACALPVLASRAGDNAHLAKDGECGFLFEPESVPDIATAIRRFCILTETERRTMGCSSRKRAEELLSPSLFVERYMTLIEGLG